MEIQKYIDANGEIRIVSGEGTLGGVKPYKGDRDIVSIVEHLVDESCGGDRWARAEICTGQNATGDIWEPLASVGGA